MPPAISAEVPTSSRLSAGVNSVAAALEEVLLGPGPDRLGVEQQAVVVEDDRVGQRRLRSHRGHQASAASSAASSSSTSPSSFSSASAS